MGESYSDRSLGQILRKVFIMTNFLQIIFFFKNHLKTYLSGTERWNNGKNMLFINFQMDKGNFLSAFRLETFEPAKNINSEIKRNKVEALCPACPEYSHTELTRK